MGNITGWYGNSTERDHKAPQRVVHSAERTKGAADLAWRMFIADSKNKASRIIKDFCKGTITFWQTAEVDLKKKFYWWMRPIDSCFLDENRVLFDSCIPCHQDICIIWTLSVGNHLSHCTLSQKVDDHSLNMQLLYFLFLSTLSAVFIWDFKTGKKGLLDKTMKSLLLTVIQRQGHFAYLLTNQTVFLSRKWSSCSLSLVEWVIGYWALTAVENTGC